MDGNRFDQASRLLARRIGRRAALAGLFGLAAGAVGIESASAADSSTCASDTGPVKPPGRSAPIAGKRARTRGSKSGIPAIAHSSGGQETTASMAVRRVQRLGPRSARMRETSMGQ